MNSESTATLTLAALQDTFQPSAGRASTPCPQWLVFTFDSVKTLTSSGLRLDNSLSPTSLNSVPFLFACRSLIKMWRAISLSPGEAELPPPSLPSDGFPLTALSEICYSGSS